MIDESKVEGAMNFLAETDATVAEQKAAMRRTEILCKRVRARAYILASGTVAEREAQADLHEDVLAADDMYIAAVQKFETTKARRQRAELTIDVWRTLEASRRKA